METTTQAGFDQRAFESFVQARQDPAWLVEDRREAWRAFCELDWPTRQHEDWARTDIRMFKPDRFTLPGTNLPTVQPPNGLLRENVALAGYTTAVNSHTVEAGLESHWATKGVLFGNLTDVLRQHESTLKPYLLRHAIDPTQDKFTALHAACWSGGTVVYVPRGVVVDQPLHTLSVLAGGVDGVDGVAEMGHLLVVLEDGAEATLLCETAGGEGSSGGLHCGGTEIFVGRGAHLRLVNLQNWDQETWHFAHQKIMLGQDASLQWTVGAIGSRLAHVHQTVELAGQGANCQVNGVLFTEGKQQLTYNTLQHHMAPRCRSDFLYKAALQDRSRTVWRGMIRVDSDAQKTDGYQRNDNLLLSSNVRADSIPGLEILADDVRCSHGSTSGRVDEELIFYAQSRGFTRKEAIRLIVTGFFQQIFDRISIDSVRDALGHAIARRVREYE